MFLKKFSSMIVLTIIWAGITLPFIQGCSVTSPLLSTRNDRATVVLEKPPLRIILSGEYTEIETDNLIKVLQELRKHKYHNYNFDDSIIIDTDSVWTSNESHMNSHQRK